jgi:hypothetical protein
MPALAVAVAEAPWVLMKSASSTMRAPIQMRTATTDHRYRLAVRNSSYRASASCSVASSADALMPRFRRWRAKSAV